MTEKLIADAQRLAEDVSQRADYGGVFQAIQAGIDHILDSRDEWRKLTRAELIDNLMAVHHAGLTPQISVAVVGLAAAVGRDVLRERDRLAARVAELEAEQSAAGKALDKIARYVRPDEDGMWTDADGLLEGIGNAVESTGRKVWDQEEETR